ncbi:MAG: hypothetical protein ABW221_21790 [Vicinamibacteria bacterium]
MRATGCAAALLLAATLHADPPSVSHQQVPCTVPGQPFQVCATVTDDGEVAKARVYFKAEQDKYYSFVDMAFGGIEFCATLPAARENKAKQIEYYVQAVDDQYETHRTSSALIELQPAESCAFAPVDKDPARTQAITVHATHQKQGRKVPDAFVAAGVTFVPVQGR